MPFELLPPEEEELDGPPEEPDDGPKDWFSGDGKAPSLSLPSPWPDMLSPSSDSCATVSMLDAAAAAPAAPNDRCQLIPAGLPLLLLLLVLRVEVRPAEGGGGISEKGDWPSSPCAAVDGLLPPNV